MKSKRRDYEDPSGYLRRLIIIGIAIFAVLTMVFIASLLLGGFSWHVAP